MKTLLAILFLPLLCWSQPMTVSELAWSRKAMGTNAPLAPEVIVPFNDSGYAYMFCLESYLLPTNIWLSSYFRPGSVVEFTNFYSESYVDSWWRVVNASAWNPTNLDIQLVGFMTNYGLGSASFGNDFLYEINVPSTNYWWLSVPTNSVCWSGYGGYTYAYSIGLTNISAFDTLLLRKEFVIPAGSQRLDISIVADNGCNLWVNGNEVRPADCSSVSYVWVDNFLGSLSHASWNTNLTNWWHVGHPNVGDFELVGVSPAYWRIGTNLLAVMAVDDGNECFYDNRITIYK